MTQDIRQNGTLWAILVLFIASPVWAQQSGPVANPLPPAPIPVPVGPPAPPSFNYNVFDFELARSFDLANCFTLRLLTGTRSARIDQNFNALYDGVTANRDFVSTRVRFDGVGPRVGGEGWWHPAGGLGF